MTETAQGLPALEICYPEQLPVSQRKDDIAQAIGAHQVVILAGETGSGKTTQLPKICLELGRGRAGGVIGHTQPRRIAARTVAERIAEELGTPLGQVVGYKVRFTDRSSDRTLVKVMTDGILLAEIHSDRELRRYDTIIIDEAHERSLNIDFILGYLKQLLPRRPDLKVIITSATIDPLRFAAHFDDAPVIEVSGRTFPVEVRYRDEMGEDQVEAVTAATRELMAEGSGDILVFFSGEREIRDAAEALQGQSPDRGTHAYDVLPLYGRLSAAEQHRVFATHSRRRIVLATNVAETSLTVPGIRYVVDTGLARISRYSARSKVQRLPIEAISRASADQRKGRCGRVADGICIRLYAEEDYAARPEFTEPEIVRTNLAAVILQMTALDLGEMERFPFVDPPDRRSVQAGMQLLEELGAISTTGPARRPRLTAVGRQLARLPVDPRLGRMVIDAGAAGCLREVITIAAALSMQDPRERPVEQREMADAKHRRFADKTSDFAGILNLWAYLKEQQAALSSSAFRRLCRTDFLNYLRIREWQELDTQLRQASKQLGLPLNSSPGTAEAIHRSLLAGLLSHIGVHDVEKRDYLGARGARFAIFPGSALFKRSPAFVMAAELVETGRLWARVNAAVQPEWMESVGAHLVKRSYSEPHWEKKRGAVVALEKVTLYGVPIVTGRKVDYGRIDPETARDLFIRHALVQGEWQTHHRFWRSNQELLTGAEQLEHRARRRDIVVDEETLYELYDERVPEQVVSVAHFDSWWKRQRRRTPDLLTFTLDMLTHDTAADVAAEDYPDVWRLGQAALPLSYEFDPGSDADGVTVDIPVTALPGVEEEDFSWPVPGLREELVVALIRSLPKRLRVSFVPAPDHARTFLHSVTAGDQPLLDALERHLLRTTGVALQRSDWDLAKVPAHLRTRFRVRSDDGQVIGQGRRLDELRKALRPQAAAAVSAAAAAMGIERSGLVSWDFDRLPDVFEQTRAGHEVTGYPALVDEGDSVAIMVLSTAAEQEAATRRGVRRLLLLANPSPVAAAVRRLDNQSRLSLGLAPHATTGHLLDDCSACAIDRIAGAAAGRLREREAFEALREVVQQEMGQALDAVLRLVLAALVAAHAVDRRLSGRADLRMLPALTDLKAQWSRLVYPGFVADAGAQALRHYPRYFAAMEVRLDKLAVDARGDAVRMASMAGVQASYLNHIDHASPDLPLSDELSEVRWMLEELRVSIWAQQLTTARSVSVPRVERALATP